MTLDNWSTSGGFNPHKNLEMLVDVFADLVADPALADLRLVMVGSTSNRVFHSYLDAVQARVAHHRPAASCDFYGLPFGRGSGDSTQSRGGPGFAIVARRIWAACRRGGGVRLSRRGHDRESAAGSIGSRRDLCDARRSRWVAGRLAANRQRCGTAPADGTDRLAGRAAADVAGGSGTVAGIASVHPAARKPRRSPTRQDSLRTV